eukprot:gnl/MRDRNA2_/MRDRNA2_49970_c0_seq2.p1 gnl/MRDRNA2_/MRDRNA2_49970_c0~~gnl/MRDRNA2_/MRDRNA2_49970_c0_seq2.p1  ORF type:complete len:134 (+),score=23.65 gnl/MRDRNA2_/MRDRNA2_49970_c0_seq2:118-519(+)
MSASHSLPSLQEALSELLRNPNIANVGPQKVSTPEIYPRKVGSPLRINTPPEKSDIGLTTFGSKFSATLDCEDPEWITPQGKMKSPPGLTMDQPPIGRFFEENDKTPRTNHSLLGGCFGPANGPAWGRGPAWL